MTRKIYVVDDVRVEVNSAASLVRYMHRTSRSQSLDDQAWMEDVADRTILQSRDKLRTGSAEEFVEDMVANGLIVLYEKVCRRCALMSNEEYVLRCPHEHCPLREDRHSTGSGPDKAAPTIPEGEVTR